MCRDISFPPAVAAEGEEVVLMVVVVVVRVHVDSSGWIGWGNGPCNFFFFGFFVIIDIIIGSEWNG